MKVYDYEVGELQYASAIARMKAREFKCADIIEALTESGVPSVTYEGGHVRHLASRVADRIIQQNKKLGKISLLGGALWRWNH